MKSGCCTICLEPLFKDIQVSHCGHVFHRSCIYRWIDSATTCPNCKQHLDASELTNLFLEPVEIIKEVLNDPSVLENVDSELLLKFATSNKLDDDDDDNEEDSDVDLEILNLKNHKKEENKKKTSKKGNVKMELIESKIKNTALTNKNNELNESLNELHGKMRVIEDGKSELNRKIQGYLKTAQIYEEKYFCAEEKLSKLNRQIFDKNKEINSNKQHIETLIRQQSLYEHCENIMIGNFDAVNNIEHKIDSTKSKEEENKHYKAMYQWILKEYKRSQSDKERDKRNHQYQQNKWSEIHEEQRIKIEELTQCGMNNVDKLSKYKKHYFGLKEKYLAQKEKLKSYHEKNIKLQKKLKNKINDNEEEEDKMPDINKLDIDKDKNEENHENDDEINSISYSEQENMENVENVDPEKQDLNKNGNGMQSDDEDDDLGIIKKNNNNKNIDFQDGNGIFSYPMNGGGINQNLMGFRQKRASNTLFGAYQQIKSKKDGERNPFSNNSNNNNKRKRNFTQFSKGDDGRGGTKAFLTENTNFYNNNNNKNKRRRIVKSSCSSNNNNRNNRNNNNKTNITKYFQKSAK